MKPWEPSPGRWRPTGPIPHCILLSLLLAILTGCERADSGVQVDAPTRNGIAETEAARDDIVPRVRSALAEGNLEEASGLLNQRLIGHPHDVEALLLLAQVAALRGQPIEAIAIADEIDMKDPQGGIQA